MSKTYLSSGNGEITFANPLNLDETLRFVNSRTKIGLRKDTTLVRNRVVAEKPTYVTSPNCENSCDATRVTRSFNLGISSAAPTTTVERNAIITDFDLFVADVKKAMMNNWLSGALPKPDTEFSVVSQG